MVLRFPDEVDRESLVFFAIEKCAMDLRKEAQTSSLCLRVNARPTRVAIEFSASALSRIVRYESDRSVFDTR